MWNHLIQNKQNNNNNNNVTNFGAIGKIIEYSKKINISLLCEKREYVFKILLKYFIITPYRNYFTKQSPPQNLKTKLIHIYINVGTTCRDYFRKQSSRWNIGNKLIHMYRIFRKY